MMKLITLCSIALLVSAAQASVKELIPRLTSNDVEVQTQARLDLLAVCSTAGAPGMDEAERKAVSEEICQILQNDLPVTDVIQPMIRNLERIGDAEAVPTLAKLLNHKNEHVRDDARRALAVNPSDDAAKVLGAQLKMRKARSARETAGLIYALGERRQTGASKLIVVYLGSKDDQIYMAAVKALGRIGDAAAIRALSQERAKAKGYRLVQVNDALFSTARVEVFQKLYADSEPVEVRAVALLGLILDNGLGPASGAMASGNPALQTVVIEAALQSRNPKLSSLLAASLQTLTPELQVQAMGVLEFSGVNTYAQSVEPFLASANSMAVQDAAANALAHIGTSESVGPLLSSGTHKSRRALGMLEADGVDKMLEKEAASASDPKRRSAAIDALANRGRKNLIPQFFNYAAESNDTVARSAIKAIGAIGDLSHLEALVQLMIARESDGAVARDILNATVEIMRRSTDQEKAVNILVGQMKGASPRSTANILQALMQTGSKAALEPLVAAAGSSDEKLAKLAVKLLGGWETQEGIPAMLELASDESTSLANHVVLMRGVSRLLAAEKRGKFNRKLAGQALETCRRDEERAAIQSTIDQRKK